VPSHNRCQGANSPSCKGHNWLRKNHKLSQPGGWYPTTLGHQQGTRKETVLTAESGNGHGSHIARTTAGVSYLR